MSDSAIRILLIEDNPGDARLIRAYLGEQSDVSVRLEHVDTLSTGLERLENGDIDVVLLDLGLPDSRGLDTFRQAFQQCPAVPIVVLTGAPVMEQALEAVREGAADYLFKGRLDAPLLTRAIRFAKERAARRLANRRLEQSEQRFRSLVETTSDWIWSTDQAGTYTYSSPRVKDLLGYEPEEVVGKTLFDFVAPGEKARWSALVRQNMAQATPLARCEHTNLHKYGRHVILETNATPVVDAKGQLLGYRGIDRDITEFKEAQDSLRERERRYGQLLAAVTSYTYSVHVKNGAPTSTSHGEGCVAVTGYHPQDYESNPDLWSSMIHSSDREMVLSRLSRVLAGEDVPPIEHRIIRRDGATRWVRSTVIPHCENGSLVRYDGLIEDITERKTTEKSLRDREFQLLTAQKIQERLLPQEAPSLPGFDVAGALYPAEYAAGDYFDYLPMRDGTMGFVVGDVSGHGFAPALLMACTHVLLRSLVETHDELEEILTLANAVLLRETDEFRFVTLLFACLDPDERTLAYAGAGHPAGYVLDAAGNVRDQLRSMGLPLGLFEDAEYTAAAALTLEPGDTVLLLTDGFAEARSPDGDFFGTERAIEFARANRHNSAAEIAHGLCQATCDFSQRNTPVDDTTVIVIKVDPVP